MATGRAGEYVAALGLVVDLDRGLLALPTDDASPGLSRRRVIVHLAL